MATGAKAQTQVTAVPLEIYSTANVSDADKLKYYLASMVKDSENFTSKTSGTTTTYSWKGLALFSVNTGKIPSVNVPTTVTSKSDFIVLLTDKTRQALIQEGYREFRTYNAIALKIQISINATNFKDATFRQYVSDNFDTEDGNSGRLTKEECEAVKKISVADKGITSLKGVEYFTALKELYCESNQLTTLDVSKNTALTHLRCTDNQLTTLDVSKNTALTILYCQENQLTTLDLSKNTALNTLGCIGNPIDAEGMSNLIAHLPTADDGWFYALDQNQTMYVSLVLSANSKGWTIYKLDGNKFVEYAGANVEISKSNFPNDIFREYVSSNFDTVKDGYLSRDEIAAVTNINIEHERYINSLKGIEYFTKLVVLDCPDCRIIDLDVSNLTELRYLYCYSNYMRTIDVSGCTNLELLNCRSNDLTTLDVSTNTKLKRFSCDNNQLTSLDVSKNTELVNLFCDANQLTTLDVSKNTKLTELGCSSNQLTTLNLSNNTKLKELLCYRNNIHGEGMTTFVNNLPITTDGWLLVVWNESSQGNWMTTAQVQVAKDKGWWVAQHIDTSSSWVTYTGVVTIDETNFPDDNFRSYVASNKINKDGNEYLSDHEIEAAQSIDVSNSSIADLTGIEYLTALISLSCYSNQLTKLDLSNNTALLKLSCSRNQLTSLDLSKNTALKYLYCYDNQLTSLDLTNNTALTILWCYSNQIGVEAMGALVESLPTVSDGTFYVVDTSNENEGNVIDRSQAQIAKGKGWIVYYANGDEYEGITSGDADGDGEVTEEDVEAIRNYILGDTPEGFDLEAADINGDGDVNIEDVTLLIEKLLKMELECPDSHHPHMRNLGLPSGTKWACCNVGATTPEGYGNYYAWDENMVQNTWGSKWAIPSKEQIQELIDNTTSEFTTQNGVNGFLFTASNGATLFLPANDIRHCFLISGYGR